MTLVAKRLFGLIGPRALAGFDDICKHPMPEQERLLEKILHENRETAIGRQYDFDQIESFSGFQKRVPLMEYEDLQPYIDAARRGEPRQLTRQHPTFYATTSGTTGASKYIPVPPVNRRAKARLMRVWLSALFRDHPAILDGNVLQVTSPEIESYAPDGTPCGSESGHAYRNMPRPMRGMYPLPYEVFEIEDYDARYYTILRLAVADTLAAIATPNPSTILLLARFLGAHTEDLLRDVRDGTLNEKAAVSSELREQLKGQLEPDPARAGFLEGAASAGSGPLMPRHVWPELEVIACWKGGTVGQYVRQFKRYFPEDLPVRDVGWLSSEGRGSVPLSDEGDSGPLAIGTNVYEFLPASSMERDSVPDPTSLLTVDQLDEGEQYYIYLTTSGGLYRYPMHDILEVTGYHLRTPSVRFVHKGRGIVNFTGEKLTESQVLSAVEAVIERQVQESEFIAAVGRAGEDESNPSYLFLVEFPTRPDDVTAARLAHELENALAKENVEYAAKRESGRLDAAVLRVLEPGQFERFRRSAVRKGRPDSQFKILRVTDDEAFARNFDGILGEYRGA